MVSITVVGVPEDGCLSLSSRAVSAVSSARIVAGHPRHLTWFPQYIGEFIDMTKGFSAWLNLVIDESEEGGVVVLASGDPLFYGIGNRLVKKLGADEVRFIASLSSPQLAFSRLGLSWNDARFYSCHGRSLNGLTCQLQQGDLFALLTDGSHTPQVIAQHMAAFNESHWDLTVCEDLGSSEENIHFSSVDELIHCDRQFSSLNILVAQRGSMLRWGGQGQFASDESFSKRMPKNGLITKQAVRNLVVTSLRIRPDDTVWDIGSGSGSVAIEAGKLAWKGQVFAVECNDLCFSAIKDNKQEHATDNVTLICEKAPSSMNSLPNPDAIFIGGTRGEIDAILSLAWQRLNPNGRLIASAVTIDTVSEVYQWAKENQLTLSTQIINISQTQPLAHYQRYQAENPIHLFSITKTLQENS
ncbi:precorrin-6y C5,15-methyltransferase (decarboxylating) subunit CbiE [Vibrio sp. DW001]|uniref:precorrin-6y C5,15-methyltransferase (decarboxylating) subunit CbiE n=1 Tax=Vibrio sp. DW001 TaxID=2912315 RepID=UPI0023AEB0D2|nr:precorrin-6y C5,15-methyltransferase (decarboxylating) subunit CbiE [Vibrio sp. DW001]WED28715.1 precorrin-6y C5,15-methyltransferase (decarboxylating) subunit CbiE [Vibrio sp. DW001]